MNAEEFSFMEVKPKQKGVYKVTLFQFEKVKEGKSNYIHDKRLEYDGENWYYGEYNGNCYACFIKERWQ